MLKPGEPRLARGIIDPIETRLAPATFCALTRRSLCKLAAVAHLSRRCFASTTRNISPPPKSCRVVLCSPRFVPPFLGSNSGLLDAFPFRGNRRALDDPDEDKGPPTSVLVKRSATPASLRPRRQPQPVSAYDPRYEGYQAATAKGQATPLDTLEYHEDALRRSLLIRRNYVDREMNETLAVLCRNKGCAREILESLPR
ncbi:hypothetical protein K0M31_002691 [Melipona bicolor]|uniref:Uncharacterized protein n=1 Tax=Melipona bicolor TaxID=60889 RepID=A0AA40KPS8_9HYME|nr:hypothetical protein K0M31_002691 [Melipona bicolor]